MNVEENLIRFLSSAVDAANPYVQIADSLKLIIVAHEQFKNCRKTIPFVKIVEKKSKIYHMFVGDVGVNFVKRVDCLKITDVCREGYVLFHQYYPLLHHLHRRGPLYPHHMIPPLKGHINLEKPKKIKITKDFTFWPLFLSLLVVLL